MVDYLQVLTYMSIRDEIKARCDEGRLCKISPAMPTSPEVRVLYVCPEINRLLVVGPWADPKQEVRWGRLRADLDFFIEGGLVQVPTDPRRAGNAYMAQLQPASDEVWEIRSRDPKPSLRIFGRFAERDLFIALGWNERPMLGAPTRHEDGTTPWRDAMVRCITDWRNLFYAYPPLTGSYPYDYLSLCILV